MEQASTGTVDHASSGVSATAVPSVASCCFTFSRASLPFPLTDGQRTVIEEISSELAKPRPMQRLLEGEVGSGKTIVSVIAMLQAVDQGMQCALLAPTEVLATLPCSLMWCVNSMRETDVGERYGEE